MGDSFASGRLPLRGRFPELRRVTRATILTAADRPKLTLPRYLTVASIMGQIAATWWPADSFMPFRLDTTWFAVLILPVWQADSVRPVNSNSVQRICIMSTGNALCLWTYH